MNDQKGKDPVDKLKPKKDAEAVQKAEKKFDITQLSIQDFQAIPRSAARSPHPFQGYPKKLIKIGEIEKIVTETRQIEKEVVVTDEHGKPVLIKEGAKKGQPETEKKLIEEAYKTSRVFPVLVNRCFVVAVNPTKVRINQDPSGMGKSVFGPAGDEKITTIKTTHNRIVVDYENGGINLDVDFGRELKLSDGSIVMCAIVPSHSARAQLVFKYNDKTQRIEEDDRYLVPDLDQVRPLRRVFEMIINPKLKAERWAQSIAGESQESLDELAVNAPMDSPEG